jgi:hypothetical protein
VEERQDLVAHADGDRPLEQKRHLARPIAGLFLQLALGRRRHALVALSGDVADEACGQLDDAPVDGRAVLFDQHQLPVLRDRDDDHDARDAGRVTYSQPPSSTNVR